MRFDELSPQEKIEYKKAVIDDFIGHGMTESEALVNYTFFINSDPYPWLEYRYSITKSEADELRRTGTLSYKRNGGTEWNRGVHLPKPKERRAHCGCKKPVVPK